MGCAGSKHKDAVAPSKKDRKASHLETAKEKHSHEQKKPAEAQNAGDTITAFSPSPALAEAYASYISEVRRAGVESNVMGFVERPHLQESRSIAENMRRRSAQGGGVPAADGVTRNSPDEPVGGEDREEGRSNRRPKQDVKGKRKDSKAKNHSDVEDGEVVVAPLEARPLPPTASVFQCRPLTSLPVIGKGQYGQVSLASMTLLRGALGEELQPQRPRCVSDQGKEVSPGSAGGASLGSGLPHKRHFLIAVKEMPILSSQPALQVLQGVKRQVQLWTRLSAYSPRVLHCFQMECVYGPHGSHKGEEPSLGRTAPPARYQPAKGATFHDFDGIVRRDGDATANGSAANGHHTGGDAANTKKSSGALSLLRRGEKRETDSAKALDEPSAASLQKIRLYMEFAKYGTLRSFQLHEMQEKFGRSYLHELTARALMREVLLALVDIHEQDALQYDLNAKNIFLWRPMKAVYHTYFPAYISDLPVGNLLRVPPTRLQEALKLMDPTVAPSPPQPQPQQQQPLPTASRLPGNLTTREETAHPQHRGTNGVGDSLSMPRSPAVSFSFRQNYPNRQGIATTGGSPAYAGALNCGLQQNLSMVVMPPADLHMGDSAMFFPGQSRPRRLHKSGKGNDDNSEAASLGSGPQPTSPDANPTFSCSATFLSGEVSGSGNGNGVTGTGRAARAGSGNDLATSNSVLYSGSPIEEQRWVRDDYRDYVKQNAYEDCVSVPAPSPHDGFLDFTLANAVAKLTVRSELEPASKCMQVYPLHDVSDGGVAVVCHNRYDTLQDEQQGSSPEHANDEVLAGAARHGSGHISGDGGGSAGNEFNSTSIECVDRPGPAVTGPPQLLPASADFSGCVLPSSAVTGPGQSFSTSPNTAESLQGKAGSPLDRTRGAFPAHPHRNSAAASQGHRFRGPLVRLNHMAAIRRTFALTNTCTHASEVPVHRFVSVPHAAPEVLQRREFSQASDIFAFAMTFIELVTDGGDILAECNPKDLPRPKTRKEKDEYDSVLCANLNQHYNARIDALNHNRDAAAEEQRLPDTVTPARDPVVVSIPGHLSDECKNVLKWCLQTEPRKRPTAVELLSSKYFLFGDWIDGQDAPAGGGAGSGPKGPSSSEVKLPEKPWDDAEGESHRSNELLAQAAGFPVIPSHLLGKTQPPAALRRT